MIDDARKIGRQRKIPKPMGPEEIVYGDKVINLVNTDPALSWNSFLAACSSSGAACERMATSQSLVARAVPRALDPYSTTASMPGIEATASAAVRRRRACVVVFIPMYPAGRANNRSVHSRIADTRGRYRKRIPCTLPPGCLGRVTRLSIRR